MQDHAVDREFIVVAVCGTVLTISIPIVVTVFALDTAIIIALSSVVLFGSIFGELRDT